MYQLFLCIVGFRLVCHRCKWSHETFVTSLPFQWLWTCETAIFKSILMNMFCVTNLNHVCFKKKNGCIAKLRLTCELALVSTHEGQKPILRRAKACSSPDELLHQSLSLSLPPSFPPSALSAMTASWGRGDYWEQASPGSVPLAQAALGTSQCSSWRNPLSRQRAKRHWGPL